MMYFLACIQTKTPEPMDISEQTEEISVPSDVSRGEMNISLEQTKFCHHMSYRARTKNEFSHVSQHPHAQTITHYFSPHIGVNQVMVGVERIGERWQVSADFDENGAITEKERFWMESQPSQGEEMVHSVQFTVSYPTKESPSYQIPVSLTLTDTNGSLVMSHCVQAGRKGVVPIGTGVLFEVHALGGDFSSPNTEIIVDSNGDGQLEMRNYLDTYKLKEGLIQIGTAYFSTKLDSAGTVFTLVPTNEVPTGLHLLNTAPPISDKGTDGEQHSLEKYKGKPLILDFWATWCASCIALHPDVMDLAEKYQMQVLGVSADESIADVQRWLRKNPTPWPSIVQGPEGAVNIAYGVNEWPTHVLLDTESRLLAMGDLSYIQKELERLYPEKSK